jgi:hypothetical protein
MRKQWTHLLALGIIALAALFAARHATAAEAKPNLIFIFVDDQGYQNLGLVPLRNDSADGELVPKAWWQIAPGFNLRRTTQMSLLIPFTDGLVPSGG